MHHRQKVDAPSGTAVGMGRAVAKGRGVALSDVMESGRHGHTGARKTGAIGFAALRGGQVVGEHTLIFAVGHRAHRADPSRVRPPCFRHRRGAGGAVGGWSAAGALFDDGRAGDGVIDGAARLAARYPRVWHVIEADGAASWITASDACGCCRPPICTTRAPTGIASSRSALGTAASRCSDRSRCPTTGCCRRWRAASPAARSLATARRQPCLLLGDRGAPVRQRSSVRTSGSAPASSLPSRRPSCSTVDTAALLERHGAVRILRDDQHRLHGARRRQGTARREHAARRSPSIGPARSPNWRSAAAWTWPASAVGYP